MSKYVIIHGQLHEVSDDELMHWKYLRREKQPDGTYRYFYEEDDSKLNIGKVSKIKIDSSASIVGSNKSYNSTSYMVKSKETGNEYVKVSKNVYDKTKTGRKWFIGNAPLNKVIKEQSSIYKSYVNDLIQGNLTRQRKKR